MMKRRMICLSILFIAATAGSALAQNTGISSGYPTPHDGFNRDAQRGHGLYLRYCVLCHGEAGKGNRELGAPNLTDPIWLYGSDTASIVNAVWNGRGAVMPAWAGRLDDVTIKALAVYVHSLGGGEK